MSALLPEPDVTIVTGASGWFGRGYLDALHRRRTDGVGPLARDGRTVALVAAPADVEVVSEVCPSAEVHVGDIAEPEVLERLFREGANASLVHAAGVVHAKTYDEFDHVNHQGTRGVVAAAARAGVRRMVHVSSNSPYGVNPRTDDVFRQDEPFRPYLGYGESKMRGEVAVREAHRRGDLETTIVRPPWFYGPWQPLRQTSFFKMVRSGRFPILGDGTQRRSMAYVDNLVQGVALAERHPAASGRGFWVADARPYPMNEIIATVKQVLAEEGYPVSGRQVRLPALAGKVAETADRVLQSRRIYHQQMHVMGEMDKTIACDIDATRDQLGYEPMIDLTEGMRRSVQWCRSRGIAL